jgi:hypothetical protein
LGFEAGKNLITDASNNILLGAQAGLNLTSNNKNNILIGNAGIVGDQGRIRIGTQGTQTRGAFIAGITGAGVVLGQQVLVDQYGQLGVTLSSKRYKQDIQPMGDVSEALMQLHPVTFHYRQTEADGTKPIQYGLIAEEVEKVMPGLVAYDQDGSPQSVAYQVLPSLLLNEYQKQDRELAAANAELASIQAEIAGLKQKLSRLIGGKQ